MLRSRRVPELVLAPSDNENLEPLRVSPTALLAGIALVALLASAAGAQESASDVPLHLPANRFELVESGDAKAPTKPLRIHNGSTGQFTDVRLTKVAYADSSKGSAWLVALPRQTSVAADELATVGTICVDAAGLPAGTYKATAAVAAREVGPTVPITVTLTVTEAGARAGHAAGRCAALK